MPSPKEAPVAILADASSGQILFSRQANRQFLPASMTKAMTALVAFDLIKQGRLHEDAQVTVRPQTALRWAGKGTTLNLKPDERVTVEELIRGTVTVSANDAAVALAEAALGSSDAFVAAMNNRARILGMSGSHFGTPNGFPDHGKTRVTANDLVRLGSALIVDHPDLYRRYFGKKTMLWRGKQEISHDPFAGVLPGADGIKTGFTSEAGYNFLGAVTRNGRRLILVVGGTPSEATRASAARRLAEWGYAQWRSAPFLDAGQTVGQARVQNGAQRSVALAVPRRFAISFERSASGQPVGRVLYSGPLRAPLAKGQLVGRLEVSLPGQARYYLPLVTANAVPMAGPIDRIRNALLQLVP